MKRIQRETQVSSFGKFKEKGLRTISTFHAAPVHRQQALSLKPTAVLTFVKEGSSLFLLQKYGVGARKHDDEQEGGGRNEERKGRYQLKNTCEWAYLTFAVQ